MLLSAAQATSSTALQLHTPIYCTQAIAPLEPQEALRDKRARAVRCARGVGCFLSSKRQPLPRHSCTAGLGATAEGGLVWALRCRNTGLLGRWH
mmetsp:Transcript_7734/g.19216  ORF Transcript_7734/g.19216 Transcript_7734/m.19216 type:complete len:94 (-) Transcript_7734:232-513(-)